MATTKQPEAPKRNFAQLTALGVLVAAAVVLLVVFLRKPPQMGPDEEVFRTVDALFTAVTSRDEKRLGQCEERLHAYRQAGRMPKEAADFLDGVIAQGRGGKWQAAAKRLYGFMMAQRREGAAEHLEPKKAGGRAEARK